MRGMWLVQRLTRKDRAREGFDGYFGCQYMGSAEFEWGALPESLTRIRKGEKVGLSTVELNGRTVYLYGPKANREAVAALLPEWVTAGCPGKEPSYFDNHLAGVTPEWGRADAWWALREDVMFTLSPDVAQVFVKAVKG